MIHLHPNIEQWFQVSHSETNSNGRKYPYDVLMKIFEQASKKYVYNTTKDSPSVDNIRGVVLKSAIDHIILSSEYILKIQIKWFPQLFEEDDPCRYVSITPVGYGTMDSEGVISGDYKLIYFALLREESAFGFKV